MRLTNHMVDQTFSRVCLKQIYMAPRQLSFSWIQKTQKGKHWAEALNKAVLQYGLRPRRDFCIFIQIINTQVNGPQFYFYVYFVKQLPSDEGFHVNSIQNVLQVEKCLGKCHGYDAYNYIMMAIFQFHFTCGKPASKTCGKTLIQKRSWPFKKLIINSLKFWVTKSRQVRLLPKEYTILSDDVWCSYFENE